MMMKSFLVRPVLRTRRRAVRATSAMMLGIVMASLALITNVTQAGVSDSLIAYWNFNDEPGGSITAPLQASVGSAQIDISGFGGAANIDTGFGGGGTTLNSLSGDLAGNSFRLFPDIGLAGNFTHIDFEFSMVDREDLTASFAYRPFQSSSDPDLHTFTTHVWSWSVDGADFIDVIGYDVSGEFGSSTNNWHVKTLDFSSIDGLDGAANATLRLTVSGATFVNGFTSFDNIQIHAEPVKGGPIGDLTGDGVVNVADLLQLLGNWGTDGPGADLAEPHDVINVADLLVLLANWG